MFAAILKSGRVLTAALAVSIAPLPGAASTLGAGQILHQFNLVVFGDHALNSQVHGRAFVGGNVAGSGSMTTSNYTLPASDYADVSVGGNAAGNINTRHGASVVIGGNNAANINNAGSVRIGGANSGVINNTPVRTQVSDLNLGIDPFRATMTAASQSLSNLAATASITTHGQGVRFDASPVDGPVVYNITASQLTGNELDVRLNGADTVVINVSGSAITLNQNFNTAEVTGANVLWNFFEATTLNLNNRFVGSVLAPMASFTNRNNVHGSVVVNSFVQNGQIHQQAWGGSLPTPPSETPAPVPLPAAVWLLIGGLGVLFGIRRRRLAGTVD